MCVVTSSVHRHWALFNSPANYVISFAVNAKADRCAGSRYLYIYIYNYNSHHGGV